MSEQLPQTLERLPLKTRRALVVGVVLLMLAGVGAVAVFAARYPSPLAGRAPGSTTLLPSATNRVSASHATTPTTTATPTGSASPGPVLVSPGGSPPAPANSTITPGR
jgi:hypothetical protein